MTYSEIVAMLTEMELPYAYDHFAEGESPEPPFLLFLFPGTDNFIADGITYAQITEVAVELYTDAKNPPLEKRIEDVFQAHEQPWDKTETWIEEEKLYEVLYEFSVPFDPEEESDEESDADPDGKTLEEYQNPNTDTGGN